MSFATSEGFTDEDFCDLSEDDTEIVDHFKSNLGYFIAHRHLFSTWLDPSSDFDVSDVRDALSAFSRLIHPNHKRLFEGIFKTLETGPSKLGDTAAKQTKAISELIQLIEDIPTEGRQSWNLWPRTGTTNDTISDFAPNGMNVPVAAVPESTTWALMGLGLLATGFVRRRKARPRVIGGSADRRIGELSSAALRSR